MTLYFSSDHHLAHASILKFLGADGKPFRGQFADLDEMHEYIIEMHNSVVKDTDKVYFLGDLGFGLNNQTGRGKLDSILYRMNGQKRLILGNHDYVDRRAFEWYFKHFEKVMESRRMDGIVFSHRPILIGDKEERIKGSCHGHIHEKVIDDPRYLNVSVEQIDYTPVSYDWIVETFRKRGIDVTRVSTEGR